jgi:hypothetical protein
VTICSEVKDSFITELQIENDMKKMRWLPAMLLAGVFAFTACSDDEKNGDVFSSLTEEQHKEKIEQEGIAMVQEMDDLTNLQTYDVIDAFEGFASKTNLFDLNSGVIGMSLGEVVSLKKGPKATEATEKLPEF